MYDERRACCKISRKRQQSEKWKEARGEEQENDWWKREEMRGAGGLCTVRRVDKAAVMRCWGPGRSCDRRLHCERDGEECGGVNNSV